MDSVTSVWAFIRGGYGADQSKIMDSLDVKSIQFCHFHAKESGQRGHTMDGNIKRTTLRLTEEAHKRLRVVCAMTGETQSDFIDRITGEELERLQRPPREPMDTTTYLLSSPANAARLMEAINDHRAGRNMQVRELLPDVD
jgi:hypothetical protein